jgi:hypothetical protein
VLAAYRPTGKGRVERQVAIVREHVLAGRTFSSLAELDAAFRAWVPIRRGQLHRTHGEVIGVRAEADRHALVALPAVPYLVTDRCLRRVGKDCLVSFEASLYSVPAVRIRAGQRVEIRAGVDTITIHTLAHDTPPDESTVLAVHPRATRRGSWIVDESHWNGLPDGHTRATTRTSPPTRPPRQRQPDGESPGALSTLLTAHATANVAVAHRPLAFYDTITGLTSTTTAVAS